ncbi:MAG TPA: T9SS type A sorting domain-containing protein, partial [Flavobacteriales bacterium]|nr:T9SS type A sorting domain-containing protein [Flavobacteriales bacterium]
SLIFPQPASDLVTIRSTAARPGSLVQVMDAMGRVALTAPLNQPEQTVDIHSLASGTYTVVIVNGTEAFSRGRLVVARTR